MNKKKIWSIIAKTTGIVYIITAILIMFDIAHLDKFGQITDEIIIGLMLLISELDVKENKNKEGKGEINKNE